MLLPPPTTTLFPYTTLSDLNQTRNNFTSIAISGVKGDKMETLKDAMIKVVTDRGIDEVIIIDNLPKNLLFRRDRKRTRLNSSHPSISYVASCLKKKTHTFPA